MNGELNNAAVKELRLQNLNRLIGNPDQHGRIAEFAKEHGIDASLISQFRNRTRNIGEKAARKLEAQIGVPSGTLDISHGSGTSSSIPQANLSPDLKTLLDCWNSSNPEGQEAILKVARLLAGREEAE